MTDPRFPPGWLQKQIARSVANLDRLPPGLRRSLDIHRNDRQGGNRMSINPGTTVDFVLPLGSRRVRGTVTAVAADGLVTAEFPQLPQPPMTVTAQAEEFIPVATSAEEATR
jgi:hypothetical protein